MKKIFTTLLDSQPPNCDELKTEGSGIAQVNVFQSQLEAEYKTKIKSAGDKTSLSGISTNLLRISCDFFWASFICKFLNSEGVLTDSKKIILESSIDEMMTAGVVDVGDNILKAAFSFLEYCVLSSFHLNAFAAGQGPLVNQLNTESTKRKRIVDRLAKGLTSQKRRRFPISKVKESLQCFTSDEIDQQLNILATHVIVENPSRKSVCLVENLSDNAEIYLKSHCMFKDADIIVLKTMISELS